MRQQGSFILLTRDEFWPWLQKQTVTRKIGLIQEHHTADPSYKNFTGNNHFVLCESMKRFHIQDRGFQDIAQHFTTFPDGTIMICRPLNIDPAGIKGANTGGICIENLGCFDLGKDKMTEAHRQTIIAMAVALCKKFGLPADTSHIIYHHWYDLNSGVRTGGTGVTKSCPGTNWFGGNTIEATQKYFIPLVKSVLAVKYSKVFLTHIFEFDPTSIKAAKIKGTGQAISQTYPNFVCANFFANDVIGWLISEGKILHRRDEYKTWRGNPKGTLMVMTDGSVRCGLMLDSDIAPLADAGKVWFCCQGFNLFPFDITKEGFLDNSIARNTNRVSIGYNKTTDKIILAVRPFSDASRAQQTMKNLGCDVGICLDSGSSTNLYKDGKALFKTNSTLTNILHW